MSSTVPPSSDGVSSAPPPPAGPPPTSSTPWAQRVDWSAALRTDWMGPVRVSAVILGVAGLLAVLIGLGMRPAIPGLHWSFKTTLLFFAWLWGSAFGADLTGKAGLGGMDAGVGVGTFALTITIVSLGAGVWLFRRYTAGLTTATGVAWFAVRTAVLTAIPPLVVSWVLSASLGDLLHLGGQDADELKGLNIGHLKVGVSSTGSFFLTLLLTLLVLLAATLTRPGLFTGKVEQVRTYVAGPVLGTGVLLVALVPAGLLAAVFIWLFHFGHTGGTHLTWHEWMNVVAAAIAFAPNLALWELGLGSAAKVHAAASTSLGSMSVSSNTGLKYWTGSEGVNNGIWFAVVLAPIVLAVTAYLVVRRSRPYGAAEQAKRLATWVVSLLVVLPCLFHFASIHGHASASGLKKAADSVDGLLSLALGDLGGMMSGIAGSLPNKVTGNAVAGPGALAVFLVFVYAAIVAVIVALATGIMSRSALTGLRSRLDYKPAGTPASAASAEPTTYQVGDVVNGWRWTGTEWVPAAE